MRKEIDKLNKMYVTYGTGPVVLKEWLLGMQTLGPTQVLANHIKE